MNYVGILAGGKGKRMGKTELPKQFLMLGTKPIIIHTLEQFLISSDIDKIIIAVPLDWLTYTKNIIDKYHKENEKISIIEGGKTRNETIIAICKFMQKNYEISDDDILITHDAVRPFITQKIINENIKYAKEYDAVDTVIPATDTIVESMDNNIITNIPIRDFMYQGQTPQTFKINELVKTYEELNDEEKNILTDAAKIYVLKNKKVKLVLGESYNMKITTQYDLKLANLMIGNKGEE